VGLIDPYLEWVGAHRNDGCGGKDALVDSVDVKDYNGRCATKYNSW
jgi:hypothetical protein